MPFFGKIRKTVRVFQNQAKQSRAKKNPPNIQDLNHVGKSRNELTENSLGQFFEKYSSSKEGLSSQEAKDRLGKFGHNTIEEKKKSQAVVFLAYFWGPIPWMIESAMIISAVIGNWHDFLIISVLLFVNVTVGFWHEYKAGSAIEMLKQKLAIRARALRDGQWKEIPAKELVPGDIIRIRLGDIVPADVKLFGGQYVQIDESALTGESLPVEKHESDVAYSGALIQKGEMNGLVVLTGTKTFFGKTTELVEESKSRSHFQKAIIKIGNYLIRVAIILVIVVFAISILRQEDLFQTLQFALVLAVAAIPVALPAVLSVSMAVGASILAKRKTIVRRLAAIEEIAGMDILCSDKTGTLTKNEMEVGDVFATGDSPTSDVLLFAALSSRKEDSDPIDSVITAKAEQTKPCAESLKEYKIRSFTPYDPVIKRSEATVEDGSGSVFKVTKGAVQVVLSLAQNKDKVSDEIKDKVDLMASSGYRTIAVAKGRDGGWDLVGIIPLFDPLRDESVETIKTARDLGIKIKMLTGDHVAIAKQIAKKLGLGSRIQTADFDRPDSESMIEDADGFAQVFPEHKYKIVEILRKKGHIVGMTGDGVNDAPALKKADVGIAVAKATDAAKSASDIVLTESGISVIIDAIRQSRKIFQRMKNYSIYRIGETIRVLLFITASIIAFNFYPITAIMIVLLALLNDIPIMTIAFDNVKASSIPDRWNMRSILTISTVLGVIGVVSSFVLLYIAKDVWALPSETIQSLIYLKLSVAGHMFLFVARTKRNFWTIRPSLPLFLAVICTQLVATLIAVYGIIIPKLGWDLALFVWGYAFLAFLITDFGKLLLYRFVKS